MRFSFRGLLLAPLFVPLADSLVMVVSTHAKGAPVGADLFGFALFFLPGLGFAYGTTVFGFLPLLYITAGYTRLTAPLTLFVGFVAGALSYVPMAWVLWRISGPNSGAPVEPFLTMLPRSLLDAETWAFPVGGLITAALYWRLANKTARGG